MRNKVKTYGLMIIAAVLLVAMAFAGAASADTANTSITNWQQLKENISAWNSAEDKGMLTITIPKGFDSSDAEGNVPIIVSRNVTIIPAKNAGEVVLDAKQKGYIFNVDAGNLTLSGNENALLNLTGGWPDPYNSVGGIYIGGSQTDAKLILETGVLITNCSSPSTAGGIFIGPNGLCVMNGGSIVNCISGSWGGGGVYVVDGGKFTMNGGSIRGCYRDYLSYYICNVAGTPYTILNRGLFDTTVLEGYPSAFIDVTVPTNRAILNSNTDPAQVWAQVNMTTPYSLYPCPFTHPLGYKFLGWNKTDASGTTVDYEDGAEISSTGSLTLYAVWDVPTPYDIYITNATGSYELTSAFKTVCGDYGTEENGTATIEKFDDYYLLTLDHFKASNSSGIAPIITYEIRKPLDLKVNLVGESTIMGYGGSRNRANINLQSNMTITTDPSNPGKLTVDNPGSKDGNTYAIYTTRNIIIESGAAVTANIALSKDLGRAIGANENLIITDGAHVNATVMSSSAAAENTVDAHAIQVFYGNVTISNGADVKATARSSNNKAIPIRAGKNLVIDYPNKITAVGTGTTGNATSFAYGSTLDVGSLASGYAFSNATSSGGPSSYTEFLNQWQTWTINKDTINVSNFTSVKIEKSTPTPAPVVYSSSSRQTGYTQILQEVPTTTPTPTPTDKPVETSTILPTANPTTQPTQASPVPFAGIIAGMGAAALVLARMRR